MTCSKIAYPTAKIKANGTRFRITPLPENKRIITPMVLTTAGAIAVGQETITLSAALTKAVWAGDVIKFKVGAGPEVAYTLADSSPIGAGIAGSPLKIVPATTALATGATGSTIGSIYVAGVTDIPINVAPVTTTGGDLLSGDFSETSITGTAYSIPLSINRIKNCPGQGVLLDLIYKDDYLYREVFAEMIRPNGEYHGGAAVVSAAGETGAKDAEVVLSATLSFNGCSVEFRHADGFTPVPWPLV
jgi:hypothetical protein